MVVFGFMFILISPFLGRNVQARLFDSVRVGLVHYLCGSAPIAIHPAEVSCAPAPTWALL